MMLIESIEEALSSSLGSRRVRLSLDPYVMTHYAHIVGFLVRDHITSMSYVGKRERSNKSDENKKAKLISLMWTCNSFASRILIS